jgi:PKD repeat protein
MKPLKIIVGVSVLLIILIIIGYYLPNLFPSEIIKPEAKIEINRSEQMDIMINQGEVLFFSGKNSSDEDGKIENYQWNFGDGTTSENVDSMHTYNEPGEYNVSLTVVDNDGNKDISYLVINVNSLPVAHAKIEGHENQISISMPIYELIIFNSTNSYDDDGTIVNYHWDFGDGNYSTEPQPQHQYFELGRFNITLTIIDNDGGVAVDFLEVQSVMRTYQVKWMLKIGEVIEENDYTAEGQSTEILKEIFQEQFAYVNITLNWTDRQPLLRDNETEGMDLFELGVLSPDNISKTENSTTGNISIAINFHPEPKTGSYKAKTANEAITLAIDDAEFTDKGLGEWWFNISAVECKGGNWQNDRFDLDTGNLWALKIYIFYYELEITEITYDASH